MNRGVKVLGKMTWRIGYAEKEQQNLTVQIREDEKALAHIVMTPDDIGSLIRHLSGFRANMKPEITRKMPTKNLRSPQDPLCFVLDLPVLPGKLLVIRHDGLGWLSFAFSEGEAKKLATGFLDPGKFQQRTPTAGPGH